MRNRKGLCLLLAILLLAPSLAHARGDLALSFDSGDHILLLTAPQTGQVLCEQNAQKRVPIASVTKIMTLILAFEAIESGEVSLEDPVLVSKNAAATEGSQAFLDAGSTYSLSDLIKTVIISSANDSCVAVAEYLAGSEPEFVLKMNERARLLGMENTNFATSTGLPYAGQYSTARDVALMAQELLNHELYFDWSTIWMDTLVHPSGRETELTNTNRLVRFFDGADGVKTGYSSEAGHCLAATAVRNDLRLLAVVLGYENSKQRFNHAQKLLLDGFARYDLVTVTRSGETVEQTLPVRGGSSASVQLAADRSVYALADRFESAGFEVIVRLPEAVDAPVEKGQCLGAITVLYEDGTVRTAPLCAAQAVRPNYLGYVKKLAGAWCG